MREIQATQITEVVKRLCIEANCHLPQDMKDRIQACLLFLHKWLT